jgi:hypothetical protein
VPQQKIECRVLRGNKSPLHDRFLVVDDEVYLLGSSLNEFGSRTTTISRAPAPGEMIKQAETWWADNEICPPIEELIAIKSRTMRSRDLRTLSLSELVHDARLGKYKNAFLENAYAGLPEVVAWLALQLGTNGENIDKTVILDQLHAGDQFYSDLFRSQGLLPADLNPELYGDPLSETVDKILQAITGKRLRDYSDAIIYDFLKEAVLTELARLLGRDNRYNGHAEWQSLIERFGSSSTFYTALVSAIPETTIHLYKTALAPPYDPSDVLHYLSQGYTRMDRASFHREYLKRIEQGPSLSLSELVGKLTEGADSMMLSFDQMLKKDLVGRLGPKDEVAWIDGLRWPLVQAAAINEYQELAELAALVHQLVGRRDQLQSNFVQLLLIMFQQYIGLIRRISFNLNSFESPVSPYADEPFSQQLYEEGRSRLEAWKVQGIKAATADLLTPLLAIEGPTDETQRALFDWVTAQDRERWLGTVQSGIMLPIIDQFHEHYLGAFCPASGRKPNCCARSKLTRLIGNNSNSLPGTRVTFLITTDVSRRCI